MNEDSIRKILQQLKKLIEYLKAAREKEKLNIIIINTEIFKFNQLRQNERIVGDRLSEDESKIHES